MLNKTRILLALAGCASAPTLITPLALAQSPVAEVQIAIDSPTQTDEGHVLDETVQPGTSTAGDATCASPKLFNPLTAFKDQRHYFFAPAGDFEDPSLPGWQLTGGASVTGGISNQALTGTAGPNSLSLPSGSSATTPEMCIDLDYPTFRFFATQLEVDTDAELVVDVVYPALSKNNVREADKLRLKAKDGWTLSHDVKLEPQRLGKKSGWRKIAIRFRVEPGKKAASYRIDDVLIDPRLHN